VTTKICDILAGKNFDRVSNQSKSFGDRVRIVCWHKDYLSICSDELKICHKIVLRKTGGRDLKINLLGASSHLYASDDREIRFVLELGLRPLAKTPALPKRPLMAFDQTGPAVVEAKRARDWAGDGGCTGHLSLASVPALPEGGSV
jgi:hypothetical protein